MIFNFNRPKVKPDIGLLVQEPWALVLHVQGLGPHYSRAGMVTNESAYMF